MRDYARDGQEGEGEMPKETIATRSENDTDQAGEVLERRTERIAVCWGHDPASPVEAVQVTIAQETYVPVEGVFYAAEILWPCSAHELYSVALTRREINKLIDKLRNARDRVFGTDA